MIGVCEHPSEGKQWWRPDGTLVDAPDDKLDIGGFSVGDSEAAYEIVVKLNGIESVLNRSILLIAGMYLMLVRWGLASRGHTETRVGFRA